jgi:hypothetical protein
MFYKSHDSMSSKMPGRLQVQQLISIGAMASGFDKLSLLGGAIGLLFGNGVIVLLLIHEIKYPLILAVSK